MGRVATRCEVRSNCGAHRGTTQIAKNCFKPVADSKFGASSDHHDIIRQAANNRNDDPNSLTTTSTHAVQWRRGLTADPTPAFFCVASGNMSSENTKAAIGQDFYCVPDINEALQQVRTVVPRVFAPPDV